MEEPTARILALLSHPSRVALIELLGKKAMQTDEMAAEMPIELAGTVVHLNYLINEGVVLSKRFGRRVKYWLDRERFAIALAALGDEIGIRVTLNRSFKQDAPSAPDVPQRPLILKKTPKLRTEARKAAELAAKQSPRKRAPAKATKKKAGKVAEKRASEKKALTRTSKVRKKKR